LLELTIGIVFVLGVFYRVDIFCAII